MIFSNDARASLLAVLCVAALLASACRGVDPVDTDSPEYQQAIVAFFVGLAALEAGDDARADLQLGRVTELVPEEPAGWADHGLLALRHSQLDLAAERLERARELAPEEGEGAARIYRLLGQLESARGRFAEAIANLRRASELDPADPRTRYALAAEIERQAAPDGEAEAGRVLDAILADHPENLELLLESARLAAKRGDTAKLAELVDRLARVSGSWPPEAAPHLEALRAAAAGGTAAAATRVAFLRNVLAQTPEYRASVLEVKPPVGAVGEPVERFLVLPWPEPEPAAPDEALRFAVEPLGSAPADGPPPDGPPPGSWSWIGVLLLSDDAAPVVAVADGKTLVAGGASLPFPGGPSGAAPGPNGVLDLDLDNDFKTDLLLAGAGGVRIYRQGETGFSDVTARAALPPEVASRAYTGAWAADLEADGDLDVVLAATDGAPVALRNNGDGGFALLEPFPGLTGLRGFAWADLDGDGDVDAATVDASGALRIYENERLGRFAPLAPEGIGPVAAVAVGDTGEDAVFDLFALGSDGALSRIAREGRSGAWRVTEIGRAGVDAATARLLVADLDNNGGLDALATSAAGGHVWLGGAENGYLSLDVAPRERVFDVAELTDDGRLDLVGVDGGGAPVLAVGRGSKDYAWKEVRPRAASATGDQRINSFGIGGEVEVRAGLLAEKQPISRPRLHFGLGKRSAIDLVRIAWPNGTIQGEFEVPIDGAVVFDQRLKGSCPFVFAHDGTKFNFVTDFIWRSPLGLKINAQETGRVVQTEDWVKIRGDQLAARDGFYDLRITAELWETHFFDHVSLMVVDHPAGTDVFVDERFSIPPPPLEVVATEPPRPLAGAWDDRGRDVAEVVARRDGRYLDTFGRGRYQGVTRDHWVEVDLGEGGPDPGPLWLVASGWIHPTDSSINVALGQGAHEPPESLSLEVPDGRGGWRVAAASLGFPAGKHKTVLIPLDGLFGPGEARRLRLRTNLEVFWDEIVSTTGRPETRLEARRLEPAVADLRYRGYSEIGQVDASSPELPDYNRIAGTLPRWRDLEGYHTRFGDVRELIGAVDDRYVIMNAGDEIVLRFAAPPPPPAGWVRDFVLVGDGWVKDGDFNTIASRTVLPLPAHDMADYPASPVRLEDDPVYRRHRRDWEIYHTRYVAPFDGVRASRSERRR